MPVCFTVNKEGKLVSRYFLWSHFIAMAVTEDMLERVRSFRRQAAQSGEKSIVKACNLLLGHLGDEKQPFQPSASWPVELAEQLDRATWRAEGIVA